MTAACDRGCRASFGLLVTKEMKRKEKRAKVDNRQKNVPTGDGEPGNYEGDVGGWVGWAVSELH